MVHSVPPHKKIPLWRKIQRQNFTKIEPLLEFLELDPSLHHRFLPSPRFPLNLPRRLAEKIEKGTLDDPILKQFVPLVEEQEEAPGFPLDPVQDRHFVKTPKMLQKYQGRALILASGACAMHCRFCFRQNFPYEKEVAGFDLEIEKLKQDTSLTEVILSGGDPLSLSNETLFDLFSALKPLTHIRRIRFHSRFPIGIPERIDQEFLDILENSGKQIFFIIHSNHPKELDADVLEALKKLKIGGAVLLNQSVLLKGVNDDPEVQLALSETLVNAGIIPYYLHELDPVRGTSHFALPREKGLELMHYVQARLSGFGVPRFVREIPGKQSKTFLSDL